MTRCNLMKFKKSSSRLKEEDREEIGVKVPVHQNR